MIATLFIFWVSVFAMAHSYLLYSGTLQLIKFFRGSKVFQSYTKTDQVPAVSILMAAYNEAAILEKKIDSIFDTTYPVEKIEVLVGSDNSSDGTNEILIRLAKKYKNLSFELFHHRQGKANIINILQKRAHGEILVITDANVLLENSTLPEMVRFFKDEQVGLVDTQMKNYGIKKSGISFQERSYISREVYIKSLESKTFGSMIGPFGGCYAIRKELYTEVPSNFLVDDFYICMNVLRQGFKTINNLNALVYEDVSNNLHIEFKRKIRIAIGNFQNLMTFKKLLWPPTSPIGFCFLSHKVLRWFGPLFLFAAFISNIVLFSHSPFYQWLFYSQLFLTILPIADFFLKKFGIHIVLLRFATHFYTMNLSLLIGFIKSLKVVKTNVWKPTERFQE